MTKKEQLEKEVIDFVLQQSGNFHLQDVLNMLEHPASPKRRRISHKDIVDILNVNTITFSEYAGKSKIPETFTPRHSYFKNARFMVSPRTEEIAQGILIPGHRYLPFLYPEINPWECTLVTPEGAVVPQKILSQRLEDITIHYTLFGAENLGSLLIMDQPSNADMLTGNEYFDKITVTLTVFDFVEFYRRWNFVPEDGLMFEVKDWLKGIYGISHISKAKRRELMDRSGPWRKRLETGYQRVFDTFGITMPIDEQISYAYYYAGKEILRNPPIHLGGFLDVSHKVYIVPFGMYTKLWHEEEFTMAQVLAGTEPPPKKRGFAGLLEDLYAPCSQIEVEAFVRDELFRYKGILKKDQENLCFESIIKRIFGDGRRFFTDQQWNALYGYLEKLWNRTAKSYNYFQDQISGKARSQVLEILEKYYEWFQNMSNLELSPEEIPLQSMTGIGQTYSTLTDYLNMLNTCEGENQKWILRFIEILPTIDATLEQFKENIVEQIQTHRKPPGNSRLRLVRPSEQQEETMQNEEPRHIFILRISLKDIRPQIWRSVHVPGSFTLGDLHQVIQAAMGWDDAHLHEFRINNSYYRQAGEDDFFSDFDMEYEDEEKYTLDELGLLEKERFLYIYDFGDGWHHQILVSKTLPAEGFSKEDKSYPRCLKGKRACPPEDCGGPYGYEEILEALAAPKKNKKNRELLEWAGDFDPEYFDIDQINAQFPFAPSE